MKTHYTLVTGASQGLGKALAFELAQRKMNLVMVALPDSGLKELSKFIKENFSVDVISFEADLSDRKAIYRISKFINDKVQLKYLINNAGILSRGFFDELNDAFILKQIEVNVTAPTLFISSLLGNLKRNAPAGILNVSSMASFFALPQKQVYCGTKAYLLSFSKSLRKELKKDGISVTTICPGGLNTNTRLCYQNRLVGKITRNSTLNPEQAAKISIDAMLKHKNIVIPGIINKVFMLLDKLLPEFIKDNLTNREIKKFPKVA